MIIDRQALKQHAKQSLNGKWGLAVGVSFIAGLLGGGASVASSVTNRINTYNNNISTYDVRTSGIFTFLILLVAIWAIVSLIIGGAITLGHNLFYMKLTRGEYVEFPTLFVRFSYFGKALGLYLLTMLLVFLWSLLFIIPGIIAAYRYSMASYIMAENPEIGVLEALNESKSMMKGYKMDLFVIYLSFIGWSLLCGLTCGIGLLFLNPYVNATVAEFYNQLKGYRSKETIDSGMYNI